MKDAYQPERVFARYEHQVTHTFPNRLKPEGGRAFTATDIRRALKMLRRLIWTVGIVGDYKRVFWRFALGRLVRGDLEGLLIASVISHHLIVFSREAATGRQNASNYSTRLREVATVAK
jgi:hypothetical protein